MKCGAWGEGNEEGLEGRGTCGGAGEKEEKIRRSAGGGCGGKWGERRKVGTGSVVAMATMNTHRGGVASSRGVRCRGV